MPEKGEPGRSFGHWVHAWPLRHLRASTWLQVHSVPTLSLEDSLYPVAVLPREQNHLASVKASVRILLTKRNGLC